MSGDGLYLGTSLDGDGRVTLDPDHLTTHAVCLGMAGSGKTGLGIVALEELARRGTPLLVVDLKGDMVNLLLNFPELDGPSFAPWVPGAEIGDRDRQAVSQGEEQHHQRAREDLLLDCNDRQNRRDEAEGAGTGQNAVGQPQTEGAVDAAKLEPV